MQTLPAAQDRPLLRRSIPCHRVSIMKNSPFAVERRGLRVDDPTQAIGQTRLRVLGKFSLELAHITTPALSTQKARALLAYLVAHRESEVARERLLEMFWPDATPDAARD